MKLSLLPGTFGICRLSPEQGLPAWALRKGSLVSVTMTPEELSVVCLDSSIPSDIQCDRGWSALRVVGTLPLTMTSVLSSLVVPLAESDIAVFAISTYDTDYILVRKDKTLEVKTELERFGHQVCIHPNHP